MKVSREKTLVKLISLVIALILWILVLSGRNFQISKALVLRPILSPEKVISNTIPHYVQVHFQGPKVILRGLEKRLNHLDLNLASFELGDHRISFHEEMLGKLPVGVKVISIEPSSIHVRLEQVQERVLPVSPQVVGEPAEGYQLGPIEIQPEKVVLRGAASRLQTLTTVRTEPIQVQDLTQTTDVLSQVVFEFRTGILREDRPPLKVRVNVFEKMERRLFAGVPIRVVSSEGPPAATVQPRTVEVRVEGPGSILKDFDGSRLRAVVNLPFEGKKLIPGYVSVHIEFPEELQQKLSLVDLNPKRVQVVPAGEGKQ